MRLVCLISGSGTTLQNLLDRTASGELPATIVGVVSSKPDTAGVERAKRAGVPVEIVSRQVVKSSSRQVATRDWVATGAADVGLDDLRHDDLTTFPDRVWSAVRSFSPDLVCLAGWLHLLPIPDDFRWKVLNIHPSLLPAFGGKGMYGKRVHQAVLDYGAKLSGCTVHFADDTYDTGPVVVQRAVPVLDADTADSLAERVFAAECEAYPEAIRRVAGGGWRVDGRRVVFPA